MKKEEKKTTKTTKRNIKDTLKKFDLHQTNMRGILRTLRVAFVILAIIVVIKFIVGVISNANKIYPFIYKKREGDLVLLHKKNDIVLSKEDSTNDILYANTTDRYVLFMKNSSLYLYDSKDKGEVTKILGDARYYYFSSDDKNIVSVDEDGDMYVYNHKKNEKLVSGIDAVKAVTDKHVVYVKDGALYTKGLKASKDDKKKVDKNFGKELSKLKNYVIYIDGNKKLKLYNIKKETNDSIDSDVSAYYSSEDSNNFYYLTLDNTLYYYDGNKSIKLETDVYDVSSVDIKYNEIVYSKRDKTYTLYFKKKNNDEVAIERDLKKIIDYTFIYDNKGIYYINKDNDLKYVRINGSKLGATRSVSSDVEPMSFKRYNNGYLFINDMSKNGLGTLYLTNQYKAKKVDADVYGNSTKVSKKGKKIYYLKNFEQGSGELYVYNGSKTKQIDEDVYKYQYVNDKHIFYIKDFSRTSTSGDLYLYNKNKSTKVDEEVYSMANVPNTYEN